MISGRVRFGRRVLVVSWGLVAVVTVGLSAAPTATAQDDIIENTIKVSKIVEGQPPAGVPPFRSVDGRERYEFSLACAEIDQPIGGAPVFPGTPRGERQVFVELVVGYTFERVLAVYDRDEGFIRCTLTEDPATSDAIQTPPTVVVDDVGSTTGPESAPLDARVIGNSVVVDFPYTRRDSTVHVTFTNTYADPLPLIVIAPTFTG